MNHPYLQYINNDLCFGVKKKSLKSLTESYVKPVYLYDLGIIRRRFQQLQSALPGVKIHYAMKANSNLKILQSLKAEGAHIDVVSLGEIHRALQANFIPRDIVFSGVGKTVKEITQALEYPVYQINVESLPELIRIAEIARLMKIHAPVALRLNPNVNIKTHPAIATGLHEHKFGMELSLLPELEKCLTDYADALNLVGISMHLGSQMLDLDGLREALQLLKPVYRNLSLRYSTCCRFDAGGGLGIFYQNYEEKKEHELLKEYSQIILDELSELECEIQIEPGRWLVAHAGVLLSQVQYVKETPYKKFLILDSGMNHLMRPALYQAYHEIYPLIRQTDGISVDETQYDVVGPICESTDVLARERSLPVLRQNDYLAIVDTGAYGYSMANHYNAHDLPIEVCWDE